MLAITKTTKKSKKCVFTVLAFLVFTSGVYAQTEYDFPAGDFWSLDAGVGMGNFLVKGAPFQGVIDPKLWLSPSLHVGSRVGLNFSSEEDSHDILTIEGQIYMRWNFLRFGRNVDKKTSLFAQAGIGMIAAYRGWESPFDDVHRTRGSVLLDGALGLTIPITPRWHIEPSVRGGYPHIWGISLTTGYKFPLLRVTYQMSPTRVELIGAPQTTSSGLTYVGNLGQSAKSAELPHSSAAHPSEKSLSGIGTVAALGPPPPGIEYVEVIRTIPPHIEYVEVLKVLPPIEIIKRIIIPAIEFVIFGPDIGRYNVGIDNDAQQLNELVLNATAQMLTEHPNLRVRIEGHANALTISRSEHDELLALSTMRANSVASQLRAKGVSNDQIVVVSLGGTRSATSDWDVRNMNRRVELMIIEFDSN